MLNYRAEGITNWRVVPKARFAVVHVLTVLLTVPLAGCLDTPRRLPDVLDASGWRFGETAYDGLGVAWARHRPTDARGPMHVYVEGDGRAYVTRGQASSNPTPGGFGAWQLAQADVATGAADVLHIGRPCQFVDVRRYPACTPEIWTTERFSARSAAAVAQVLASEATQPMVVVGYSGGAVPALVLTQRFQDVLGVVTVAGNLSPAATNAWHRVSAQPGAVEALHKPGRLQALPVLHLVGADDRVIPPVLTTQVLAAAPELPCTAVATVAGVAHQDGWAAWWRLHNRQVFTKMLESAAPPQQELLQSEPKACKKPAVGE